MKAEDFFRLARRVELDLSRLYQDLAGRLPPGSGDARFFSRMAAQEQVHAAWVDEIAALVDGETDFQDMPADEFETVLATIEDVYDEVLNSPVKLADAAEIIVHLESSTAERFYEYLPRDLPGVPEKLVSRMIDSCRHHARIVTQRYGGGEPGAGQGGVGDRTRDA